MTGNQNPNRVVVIGGGYAGALAANHVLMRDDVAVTLVNPRPKFVERIRLHQHAAGNYNATVGYDTLLADDVRLVVDTATRIDAAARAVELASGDRLDYDYLIYAVGSTGTVPASVPGAAEFAYPLAEFEQAERLVARLQDVPLSAQMVVVGAGLTGIEAASEFAEAGRNVVLVGSKLAPSMSAPARRSVAKALAKLGVTVIEGDVSSVTANRVTLADGRFISSAVTVWTAGFGTPQLAAASGLRTDEMGRLLTDESLTSIDDPRIVATGDAAAPSGQPLRMSCQASSPLTVTAVATVLSRIAGTEPKPLDPVFVGSCVSLGRHTATIQIAHKDDSPTSYYIGGRVAAKLKEAICKGTLWGIRRTARKPSSVFLMTGGKRAEQLAEAVNA
ncbi:NAD(P)/FAD-dependent oxidoreductase [Mycolicibacterium mucogenicum]|uniref:FAD-dependent oxidoreductase n=1 Tax=Mycolicibacterium mucogenicum DSM 44124 TaxID=1226753 RepID=A0A8H2J9H0_MYCMU|nr:FAD-dependent oxidoreductase [Mycolicibacterium mucogenicum]KAB7761477.1 FAD-dependent pyridine nucleotide-disulfide oxidoreductase [Mycolicibacterium mucogenicum DSM 44124]QPG70303.1 FAD-dependent oxidoreductase [Mycolicibacterium mucogenicum DSM 44124]